MNKKILFIYNPHSGKGHIKQNLSDILEILRDSNFDITIHPTKQEKDATDIVAEKSADFDLIVCSGGDGTLHEVTEGLMQLPHEKRRPCGYIPTGTVNDFATSLNISQDLTEAAKAIAGGHIFKYDIGNLNGKFFTYIAGFGAFMDVSYATPQLAKSIFGKVAYFFNGIKELAKINPIKMKIEINDQIIEDNFMLGVISNSYSIAGLVNLKDTEVYLDDGMFEAILVKMPSSPIELQETLTDLKKHDKESRHYYIFKTNHIKFYTETPTSWTLDGEFGGEYKESEFNTYPQAVEYIVSSLPSSETVNEGDPD